MSGMIVVAALFLTSCGPSAPPLSSPPPTPLGSVGVGVTSTPLPTAAPAEISPTPYVDSMATPAEPLASAPAAAYPAPTKSETAAEPLASQPPAAYPAPAETAAPVSATVGASVGRLAPDFNLVRGNGTGMRLSDYRGKETVVLVFFRGQT